jgi:prepilin-type N-terminal cleavage/methylation domain-containing protein
MIVTSTRAVFRLIRRRLSPAAEDGFTLIEMLAVMAILLTVLAGLTGAYVSAQVAQVDQTRRFDAQENARQALDRMRKDIHCAHGVTDPYANASGGYTIVMTETNTSGQASSRPTPREFSGARFRSHRTATSSTGRTIPTSSAPDPTRRS